MDAMKFGLFGGAQVEPGEIVTEAALGYHELGDYIAEAERLGYTSAWLVEHHFTGFAQLSATLNYLCYLCARTSTIRLGSAVVVVPWHNPILLAEQVATVDQLSKGRYDFGVGRGYRYNEFHGFSVDPDDAQGIFEESIAVIRRAFAETDRWSYKSERWQFNDIIVEPPTVQKPHPPMWVGAGSERSIRAAAHNDFHLLLDQVQDFDAMGQRIAAYREELDKLGKPYDPYMVGVTRGLMTANTDAERKAMHALRNKYMLGIQVLTADPKMQARAYSPVGNMDSESAATGLSEAGAVIGNSAEMTDRIGKLYDVGVRNVLLCDVSGSTEALHQFAEEVMPHFVGDARAAAE